MKFLDVTTWQYVMPPARIHLYYLLLCILAAGGPFSFFTHNETGSLFHWFEQRADENNLRFF
jgi:hypothetical protein